VAVSDGLSRDPYVAVIDLSGWGVDDLVYSPYLGGSGDAIGRGIAVRPSCKSVCLTYVTRQTESRDFPTKLDAFQDFVNGDTTFVTVIDPAKDFNPANDLI